MHPHEPDNLMIRGAQDELERRHARANREGVAFSLLADEFLDACVNGLCTRLSYADSEAPLSTVLRDLLDDDVTARYLANRYAERQLAHYSELGGFDE
jgi:hypothetical protein